MELILSKALKVQSYSPHFKIKETESRRYWVTGSKLHSQWVTELEFGIISYLQSPSSFHGAVLCLCILDFKIYLCVFDCLLMFTPSRK